MCSLPCCMQRRNLLFDTLFDCQIYIVGNAIMSATGTATFKKICWGGETFSG